MKLVRFAAPLLAFVLSATTALADIAPGGGSSSKDCLVVFDAAVNQPERSPRHIRCEDGAACDADGAVNGVCEFEITVCANSTFNPTKCTQNGVAEIFVRFSEDNGDPKFDPDFQALQDRILQDIDPPTVTGDAGELDKCTSAPTVVRVPIRGPFKAKAGFNQCRKNRKKLQLFSESNPIFGKIAKDRDRMKLTCDPAPVDGCEPMVLFAGTFDRIQTQIFNQSCAVSGCHDSESFNQSGGLLLEESASLGSLISVVPNNAAAQAEGWNRVTVTDPGVSGDPETSYLVHKVDGDFPGTGFGNRMPLIGKKLDQSLRDVITLWVAAGAPDTGWVPGTF